MDVTDLVQTGRALIRPLVRFFLVGAALFALERVAARPSTPEAREVLALPAGEIERRVREWTEETGGLPGEAERAALREAAIDEEVLFRTALRLRLHESVEVAAGTAHQIFNASEQDVEFLVVSCPPSHSDRIVVRARQ